MKLVCKTRYGSYLYGTATYTSDIDVRGIFIPSKRDILLGRIPRTNKDRGDSTDDYELYSLHHFVKLACEGQTLAFDMLWTPLWQTEHGPAGHVWDELVSIRHKFLSKRMHAFIGYARGQAAKYSLKGERLDKLEKFITVLDTVNADLPLGVFETDKLPRDDERFNEQGVKEIQIAGKWFGFTTKIRYVRDSVQSMIDGYGKRAKSAADASGVDWKAMSHAVRVMYELEELVAEGKITFPLKRRDLILGIKLGQLPLQQVHTIIDDGLKTIDELIAVSSLPDEVDTEFWDTWLFHCVERESA